MTGLYWTKPQNREGDNENETRPEPQSKSTATKWDKSLNAQDWSQWYSARTIAVSVLTTATTLALLRLYTIHVRRIRNVDHVTPNVFRRRSMYGWVTRVGDGDNFHLYHTPGGKLMGWGWLPWRRLKNVKRFKGETVHVRIAGVDAPELSHFGKPEQPHAKEALDWLKSYILYRHVRVYPYRRDQYDRVVCHVYRRSWIFLRSDIGLEMLRRGWATVYEAKMYSEFGSKEQEYRNAEAEAKKRKLGIWQRPGGIRMLLGAKDTQFESPREYKKRTASREDGAE